MPELETQFVNGRPNKKCPDKNVETGHTKLETDPPLSFGGIGEKVNIAQGIQHFSEIRPDNCKAATRSRIFYN